MNAGMKVPGKATAMEQHVAEGAQVLETERTGFKIQADHLLPYRGTLSRLLKLSEPHFSTLENGNKDHPL